jgi:hypothetical protein
MIQNNIGHILDDSSVRDAIHIAVAPVTATCTMKPGQHIGFVTPDDFERVSTKTAKFLGIVDPFLLNDVRVGQRFFMFLMPNTITDQVHHWAHPDFDHAVALQVKDKLLGVNVSRDWMHEFCGEYDVDYDEVMNGAHDYLLSGDYLDLGTAFDGVSTPPEFWHHYSRLSGKEVPEDKKDNFFSCSC